MANDRKTAEDEKQEALRDERLADRAESTGDETPPGAIGVDKAQDPPPASPKR